MFSSKNLAAAMLILSTAPVHGQGLETFSGTWGIKSPGTFSGKMVFFAKTGNTLKASLPSPFGQVSITGLSEPHGSADFVMSGDVGGAEFKCYYGLTRFVNKTMAWVLKDGSPICNDLKNVMLERDP